MQEASFFLNPLINIEGVCTDFVERVPGIPTSTNKEETLSKLLPHHALATLKLGFTSAHLAEQVHGPKIITVTPDTPLISDGADGLISNRPGTLLGIHVADCGAGTDACTTEGECSGVWTPSGNGACDVADCGEGSAPCASEGGEARRRRRAAPADRK